METKKTTSILPGVIYSQLKDTYTFKEITETNELEKAFRLRYEVYSESENCVLIEQNLQKVDINIYDLHSKHYGLYTGNNEIVGYFRIVLNREEYFNSKVFEIAKNFELHSVLKQTIKNLIQSSQAPYPFINFPNVPKSIKSLFNILIKKNERITEAGRLTIHKDYRGPRTTFFLIESAVALYKIICNNSHAIIMCSREHSVFYSRYGFSPFGTRESYDVCGTQKTAIWLPKAQTLRQSQIPNRFHSKFHDMIEEYVTNGWISRAF